MRPRLEVERTDAPGLDFESAGAVRNAGRRLDRLPGAVRGRKVEVRVGQKSAGNGDALAAQVQQTESALGQIRQSVTGMEERPATVSPGLNLTRRAQALRMHRRGESVETIAAALSAPRNEIDLLLKLQSMLQHRA